MPATVMVFTYRPLGVDLISARNFIKFNQARTKPNSAQIAYKVAQNTITSHSPLAPLQRDGLNLFNAEFNF